MWSALHYAAGPDMFLEPYETAMKHLNLLTRETLPIDSTPVGVMMNTAKLFGPSWGLDHHKLPPPWWDPQYKLDMLNKQISNIQASQFNHQLEKLMSVLMYKRHWLNESLKHLKWENGGRQAKPFETRRYDLDFGWTFPMSDLTHSQERGEFLSRGIPYEYANLNAGSMQPTSSQWHNLTDYTVQDQQALLQSMGYKESDTDGASIVSRNEGCYAHDDKLSCQQDITPLDVYNEHGAQLYKSRCFWDQNHVEAGSANAQRGVMGRCIPRQWDEGMDDNFQGDRPLDGSEWGCVQESNVGNPSKTCFPANSKMILRQRFPDQLFPKEGLIQDQLPDPKTDPARNPDETKVPVLVPGNPTDVDPQLAVEQNSSASQFRWYHKDQPIYVDAANANMVAKDNKPHDDPARLLPTCPSQIYAAHFGLQPGTDTIHPKFDPWTIPKYADNVSGTNNEHLKALLEQSGAAIPVPYSQSQAHYADFLGNISTQLM